MFEEDNIVVEEELEPPVKQIEPPHDYTLETTSARSSLLRRAPFVLIMTILYFVLRQFDHNLVFNPVNADIFILLIVISFVSGAYGLSLLFTVKQEDYHKKNVFQVLKRTNDILDFLSVIPALMVIFTLSNMFFVSFSPISGSSMEPNFHDDQAVVFSHYNVDYERFDVVILYVEELTDPYLIKRVIGLPGETVLIENNEIYINGVLLVQDFIDQEDIHTYCYNSDDINTCEFIVPQDSYFVLGDNRDGKAVPGEVSGYSIDSRSFGSVSKDDLFGKVLFAFKDFNLLN